MSPYKYAPYSYSKLACWNSCARKFYFQYIVRPPVIDQHVHLKRGKLVHGLIEAIIQSNVKQYNIKQFQLDKEDIERSITIVKNFCSLPNFKSIVSSKCLKLTEQNFFLDWQLNPTNTRKNALVLGYIDLICLYNDNFVKIFDWKTGGKDIGSINSFPLSSYQFEIYSVYALQEYKKEQSICNYAYVEHDHFVEHSFQSDLLEDSKKKILDNISDIEKDVKFKKTINKLCDWCDFKELCKPKK